MKNKRKLVLLVLLIITCAPLASCRADSKQNDLVRTTIADQEFQIPREYFDAISANETEKFNKALLVFEWPNFLPLKDRRKAGTRDSEDGENLFGQVLIADAQKMASPKEIAKLRKRRFEKVEALAPKYGLARYKLIAASKGGERTDSIIYEHQIDSETLDVIRCFSRDRNTYTNHPTCTHYFVSGGIWFSLTYNKEQFLNQWRNQKAKTLEFLAKFHKDPGEKL